MMALMELLEICSRVSLNRGKPLSSRRSALFVVLNHLRDPLNLVDVSLYVHFYHCMRRDVSSTPHATQRATQTPEVT